ncbi:hypothetical protein JCM10908_005852 [Rhodotorula pacifica]|uniref:YqaE/Pmp3 family membrane protein n=1 Tax=Rhodotorula pacifica TaxID=1495444 RepID=UPI00316DD60E
MAIGTYIHAQAAAEQLDHHSPYMNDTSLYGCWLWILAFFVPPVAVFLERGCGCELVVNVLLSLIAWLPGMIHAFYIILKYESPIYYDPDLFSQATLQHAREHRLRAKDVFQAGSEDEREEAWRKRGGVPAGYESEETSDEHNRGMARQLGRARR